jgi:polyhydroxyalkanoate synthase
MMASNPLPTDAHNRLLQEPLRLAQKIRRGVDLTKNWEARVGLTPHEVVFQEGKIRLLHYAAQTEKVHPVPLLVVFSLINRSYILDLKPGKSIVEKMVQSGFNVYLIDWGVPGPGDMYLTLDDYINRYMRRMVNTILDHSPAKKLSLLGYCMGGTMAAMYAALHPQHIQNLLLMAAPFDFSKKDGLLFFWAGKDYYRVDKLVEAMGNIPPWLLQSSFNLVKPMQNMLDKYVKFFDKIDDEAFVDDFLTLEYWVNDNIPLSGQVYKQFVEDCFHDNLLIQNRMQLGGRRIDLSAIDCPLMSIISAHDHLVPPEASQAIDACVSSAEKEHILFPAGHIGLSVSSKAMKDLWPRVAQWLGARSGEPVLRSQVSAPKAVPSTLLPGQTQTP